MKQYGLIGKNISYSFSEGYFAEKFKKEGIEDCGYKTYDLEDISKFKNLLENTDNLKGVNVTIPYKEDVLEFLDSRDEVSKEIGAVNTIKIEGSKLIGYNTDEFGFRTSIKPFLEIQHERALILGTGGASKAIAYVLSKLGINYFFVSRNPKNDNEVAYSDLTVDAISNFKLIINCTPLGTYPDIEKCPDIPYSGIGEEHLLYDLVYNPEKTEFLKRGEDKGASILNGLSMLQHQAEEAWRIWNK